MNKARKKLKKRTTSTIKERERKQLERQVIKVVRETNRRLKGLGKSYKVGTWSSKKLKTRIMSNKTKGLMYKGKRIKLKPKMTKTNLTQVLKATRQFLESKTSTRRGIEQAREDVIQSLKDEFQFEKEKDISKEDAEAMYEMLSNKGFNRFNIKKKGKEDEFIGASGLWSEIDYANTNNISKESFIERLQNLREQDFSIDDQKAAERIFERYVS